LGLNIHTDHTTGEGRRSMTTMQLNDYSYVAIYCTGWKEIRGFVNKREFKIWMKTFVDKQSLF